MGSADMWSKAFGWIGFIFFFALFLRVVYYFSSKFALGVGWQDGDGVILVAAVLLGVSAAGQLVSLRGSFRKRR